MMFQLMDAVRRELAREAHEDKDPFSIFLPALGHLIVFRLRHL